MALNLFVETKRWIKTQPWDAAIILVLGLVGLTIGLWARVIILDDAMITYRVAENLAHGRGFVYNVGERVQVTTTPLYAMILVPGVWLFGTATKAALVLNVALAALIPILAYDLGRRLAGRITGLGGALLLAVSPFLIMAFSMESFLYVALILASTDAYVAGRVRLAGILAGITALVRGDGALLGASMLAYDSIANRRLCWRLIGPAVTIPVVWYLFAVLYFGTPFPATLNAKTAQGQFNWLRLRFLDGLAEYWETWTEDENYKTFYLLPPLLLLGLLWTLWHERSWLILLGRDVMYVIAFVALAVPTAEWYYAPLMPGMMLLSARGIQLLAEGTNKFFGVGKYGLMVSVSVAAGLILILLLTIYPVTSSIIRANPDWKAQVYPATARWIAENTNTSAKLATIDIGHVGYWSGRPIIDIVGLAQPDVAAHIAEGDFGYAIRQHQPDLVLLGYTWLTEVQSQAWFKEAYTPREFFKVPAMDQPLLLFSRREGVKVQADTIPQSEIKPLNIDFNRQITLTGYHLSEPLIAGKPLKLTLFWQVEAPIVVDFTVFVQLVDANDNIIAQRDRKPQDGFYGTAYWQPGEQVIDPVAFPIPRDVPPGRYDILLGFYEAETGLRLQVLAETGAFKSDHVRLSGIKVQAP